MATTKVVEVEVLEGIETLMPLKPLELTPQQRHLCLCHNPLTTLSQLELVVLLVLVEKEEIKEVTQTSPQSIVMVEVEVEASNMVENLEVKQVVLEEVVELLLEVVVQEQPIKEEEEEVQVQDSMVEIMHMAQVEAEVLLMLVQMHTKQVEQVELV